MYCNCSSRPTVVNGSNSEPNECFLFLLALFLRQCTLECEVRSAMCEPLIHARTELQIPDAHALSRTTRDQLFKCLISKHRIGGLSRAFMVNRCTVVGLWLFPGSYSFGISLVAQPLIYELPERGRCQSWSLMLPIS
jgi:hypothetical protein